MPTDTLPLWRQAREFILYLFGLFGEPQHVAARGVLMPREARMMALWLRTMECILRRMLLIEAAALPAPQPSPPQRAKHARQRRTIVQNPDAPETWRVTFRAIEPIPSRRPHARAHSAASPAPRNAWPLAERLEAALRVFNDPAPYAKRLARRLARAPRLAALILLITLAVNAPGREIFAATTPMADLATEHFNPPGR